VAVTLSRVPASATVDVLAMAATAAGENNASNLGVTTDVNCTIKAYNAGGSSTQTTVEAIVPPHSGTGYFTNRVLTFTIGARTWTYTLDNSLTFEPGKAYPFTVVLTAGIAVTPQPVTLAPDGLSNCYMVAPGGEVNFPVSRAYEFDGANFTNTLRQTTAGTWDGDFVADVLWDDAGIIKSVAVTGIGNTAVITVKANSNATGNALVRICKSTQTSTAVWSYHIWATGYDPNTGTTTTWKNPNRTDLTFMDRNLGATRTGTSSGVGSGLFYQWGRKDPFPATDGDIWIEEVNIARTSGSLYYTIQYPSDFIGGGLWLLGYEGEDELWGQSGSKTIYDPCPAGWRVPVNPDGENIGDYGPWKGLQSTSSTWKGTGFDWSNPTGGGNGLYPAAGVFVGSWVEGADEYGYYWTASPFQWGSAAMQFELGGSLPDLSNIYTLERGNGFSVRCVKEDL
jgi:hypothetical protein